MGSYVIHNAATIINESPFHCLNYTSTPIHMLSTSNVDSNPRHWQPLLFPVDELARTLAVDQTFDKWKEKIIPGIYLGMSPIHARTVALVLSLSTGRVSPQFHVALDPSFTTINGHYGNLIPPRYWKDMCGFIKVKKLLFMHSEQHDPSSAFISPLDQGTTTSDNTSESEEHAAVPPVQEYNTHK